MKNKRILIFLGHPAQFHFFKHAIRIWENHGHKVLVLIRTKDILEPLLLKEGLNYVNIEKKRLKKKTKWDLFVLASHHFIRILFFLIKFRPNLIIGLHVILAQLSFFSPIKFIAVLEDDYHIVKRLSDIVMPLSDTILAPTVCDYSKWEYKKISFEGYMKLAYLHPNWFVPNFDIIKPIIKNKKYIIIRLVSLTAYHDEGIKGISTSVLENIIKKLTEREYEIFISSENIILEKYRSMQLQAPIELIHHIMAYASMVICDSQSMSVEASMLGVPNIRFSDFAGKISVLEELEHTYGLTYGIKTNNPQALYNKIDELLMMPNLKDEFQTRRRRMLADKIDVTAFFAWFIENYPESKKIMKENPDYQYRFK